MNSHVYFVYNDSLIKVLDNKPVVCYTFKAELL